MTQFYIPFKEHLSQEKIVKYLECVGTFWGKCKDNDQLIHATSTLAFAALLYYVDSWKPVNLLLGAAGFAAQKMYNERVCATIRTVCALASSNDSAKIALIFGGFVAAFLFPSKIFSFGLGYYAANKFFVTPQAPLQNAEVVEASVSAPN